MPSLPGFIDIQINGYDGVDFSSKDLTIEDVQRATQRLVEDGTWAYCPTLITNDIEQIKKNVSIIVEALSEPKYSTHFLGLHIEGPFISPLDGYRGAHPLEHVCAPSIEKLKEINVAAKGQVVLMTYAPEVEGSSAFEDAVLELGIKLSMGHTNADEESFNRAVSKGTSLFTHLGNGIRNELARHPNIIQSVLVNDNVRAGLITDGHHLGETFIHLCLKAKGIEGVYITCDCAPIAGYPPGNYNTLGQDVVISETGRLSNPTGEYLVGSASNTLDCMNHLASITDLDEMQMQVLGVYNSLDSIGKSFPEGEGLVQQELKFDEESRKYSIIKKNII
ncbi:MAG: N-acetylglucosamine-6-phosphate deacetylase [Planctomycetota bacterium]|nr:MAG: N-acetylglucosamine-6-phosphate deacetylase [Planctomycetota bacterium]